MNVRKALIAESVMLNLKSTTKQDVIREMLAHLVAIGAIPREKEQDALQAVLKRESKMSTGMEGGVAIPHGKSDAVQRMVAALAVSRRGVDFDALDGQPSYIFIMTVSPLDRTGPHIQFLAEISRLLNSRQVKEQILAAESAEEILQLI